MVPLKVIVTELLYGVAGFPILVAGVVDLDAVTPPAVAVTVQTGVLAL